MQTLEIFTRNDLHRRTQELFEDTEQGRLAVVTEHGRPAFLAVPFNDRLLNYGIHRAMAFYFFESGVITLSQAAQLAGLPLEEFIELLGETGINAVNYSPEELEDEIERASI